MDRFDESLTTFNSGIDSLARAVEGFDRRCDEQQALLLRIQAVLEQKNKEKPTSGGE